MQSKQSVTNSNNQASTACRKEQAATKMPTASTVTAALGLLSILLAASGTVHAQATSNTPPLVIQAAGPDASSIKSAVEAFRAALGDNNGNNGGPLQKGRREIGRASCRERAWT